MTQNEIEATMRKKKMILSRRFWLLRTSPAVQILFLVFFFFFSSENAMPLPFVEAAMMADVQGGVATSRAGLVCIVVKQAGCRLKTGACRHIVPLRWEFDMILSLR